MPRTRKIKKANPESAELLITSVPENQKNMPDTKLFYQILQKLIKCGWVASSKHENVENVGYDYELL